MFAAIFHLVDGLQASGLGLLRGIQDVQIPFILALLSYWIFGICSGYILGFIFKIGSIGIWLGMVIGLTVATIIPHNYSTVNGVLWLINLKHELTLDYFEGVKKKIYFKKYCYITYSNQRVLSLVYIAFNKVIGNPRKGYLEKVIDGAKSFNAKKNGLMN